MKETIGQRIAEQRKKIGLTQNELAEKLMVSNKAVSKWESDNGNPSMEFLPALSNILNCSLDYLISGKEFKKDFYKFHISLVDNQDNEIFFDIDKLLGTSIIGGTYYNRNKLLHYLIQNAKNDYPEETYKFTLIGGNKSNFNIYGGLSDIYKPTAKTSSKINNLLHDCCNELDSRFDYLQKSNLRSFVELHDNYKMPYLIILIDELSEVIDNEKNISYIQKIFQLGRACGIYMFISTDLPYDKIPDHIKNNCYTTISLGSDESSPNNGVITIKTPNGNYSNLRVPYLSEEYINELANKHS